MIFETFNEKNLDELAKLALKLWPDHTEEALREEFENLLSSDRDIVYLARLGEEYVGFIHMCLRIDYVEGSSSSPVGYIEGIYVEERYRNKGISRRLVLKGEEWARSQGCNEIASDTELENQDSQEFHKRIGFKEAGRIVAFIKDID